MSLFGFKVKTGPEESRKMPLWKTCLGARPRASLGAPGERGPAHRCSSASGLQGAARRCARYPRGPRCGLRCW